MQDNTKIKFSIDKPTVFIYLTLVIFGWLNIYAASYNFEDVSFFDFDNRAGKQFVWALTAFGLAGIIILLDSRIFNYFAYIFYGFVIILLVATIFLATDIKGSKSWLVFGPVSFQPAELAKTATALAIAKYMSAYNFKLKTFRDYIPIILLIFVPFALIVLQKETGGALVFAAFLLVLYREGMSGMILLLGSFAVLLFVVAIKYSETLIFEGNLSTVGMVLAMLIIFVAQVVYTFFYQKKRLETLYVLSAAIVVSLAAYLINLFTPVNFDLVSIVFLLATALYWLIISRIKRITSFFFLSIITFGLVAFTFSTDYIFEKVLEPHQQIRIKVLLGMEKDLRGAGYNVNQSKIAIGSGGLVGKGYLNGTQTKLKYVPEQDTDFIFCTVGEEWGFAGSTVLIILYLVLLLRIVYLAEKQKFDFNRIYGYGVASILFFHLMVNIGMVIGLMPVIGIPLPFLSYGGSSLWSFTILLFIFLRLDATRMRY